MKVGRAALGRSTPHFSVIHQCLPVISNLNQIGGRLDTSLVDPAANPFGQLRFEGVVQLRLQLAYPLARGIERSIQVLARGIARGGTGQLHTGTLNRDTLDRGVTENVQSQSIINLAPLNAKWQVLKNQLNDGGARLLPKLRAVNVRVMLTHLGPLQIIP